jgi:hypothetical protein
MDKKYAVKDELETRKRWDQIGSFPRRSHAIRMGMGLGWGSLLDGALPTRHVRRLAFYTAAAVKYSLCE